jgi:hypothetical protein
MKRKIVFISVIFYLLFLHIKASSQTIFAPIKGAKWTHIYRYSTYNSGVTTFSLGIINSSYLKDSTIENKVYKCITMDYDVISDSQYPIILDNVIYRKNTSSSVFKYSASLFTRELQDTVWGFINNKDTERPFFIFTNKSPDSFDLKWLRFDNNVPKKVYIDSIKSAQYSNRNFKTWQGKSYQKLLLDGTQLYDTCSLTFAERIGPINDILPYFAFNRHPGTMDRKYDNGLICYSDAEVGNLKFKNLGCTFDIKVSTKEVVNSPDIDCYYDELNHCIAIKSKYSNICGYKVLITNTVGTIMQTERVVDTNVRIYLLKSIKNGIYIINITDFSNRGNCVKKVFIN